MGGYNPENKSCRFVDPLRKVAFLVNPIKKTLANESIQVLQVESVFLGTER